MGNAQDIERIGETRIDTNGNSGVTLGLVRSVESDGALASMV